MEPRLGLTVTVSGPNTTVIVAVADLVLSVTEVAVRVTVAGFGTFAGSVEVAEVGVTLESVPQVKPLQPAPEREKVTPCWRGSNCTVAVNTWVPDPVWVLAVVG